MDVSSVPQQPRLSIDRVINLEFQELVECGVCHGIILDPVGCYNCDRAVCSACIHQLNAHREESICPYGCTTYTERSCPKAIAHILSSLNIICQYKSNGCDAIFSYNNIINHEKDCDYQLWSCIGCQQLITKKNFQEHNNQCPLISLICDECSSSFQRKDTNSHTLIDCLRIQLQKQISEIDKLKTKESEQERKIDLMEQRLQRYETFWLGFVKTTKQIRGMLDNSN